MHEPTTDLALRTTVRELVLAFASAEQQVRAAFAQIVSAERAVNAAFSLTGSYRDIRVSACGTSYRDDFTDVEQAVKIMTRAAWTCIVERLELRRIMSAVRWNELEKQLEKNELPPITEENVMNFARGHRAQAHDMLQEAVEEVFEWLRPRKGTRVGDLKTNSELEVPAKVILGCTVTRGWDGLFNVRDRDRQRMTGLENIFNGLDGNGTVCKAYQSVLQTAIEAAKDGTGQTSLFEFRACKNGNLHLWFKRPDLLQRFNMLAGGARLRPAA